MPKATITIKATDLKPVKDLMGIFKEIITDENIQEHIRSKYKDKLNNALNDYRGL